LHEGFVERVLAAVGDERSHSGAGKHALLGRKLHHLSREITASSCYSHHKNNNKNKKNNPV
jgi:hypothetical protein